MNRVLGITLIYLTTVVCAQVGNATRGDQIDWKQTTWVDSALRSTQTVRVGDTRADLLKIFTEEGGLSNPSQRTYVYRRCLHIKVAVKFAARETELPTDKIINISRPYLEWTIAD
jgi:hypothetical protein